MGYAALAAGCAHVPASGQASDPARAPASVPAASPSASFLPHPAGVSIESLKALFGSEAAPKGSLGEFADTCDEEYQGRGGGRSADALVKDDPVKMHWCFYSKMYRLQEKLQAESTWLVKQKHVLRSFGFLSALADAFRRVRQDTRYARRASMYHAQLSEWVFFRKKQPYRMPASVVPAPAAATPAKTGKRAFPGSG